MPESQPPVTTTTEPERIRKKSSLVMLFTGSVSGLAVCHFSERFSVGELGEVRLVKDVEGSLKLKPPSDVNAPDRVGGPNYLVECGAL